MGLAHQKQSFLDVWRERVKPQISRNKLVWTMQGIAVWLNLNGMNHTVTNVKYITLRVLYVCWFWIEWSFN